MNLSGSVLFQIILINLVKGQLSRDVVTDQGIVRGYNADADNVYSYYGIPYATAPSGEHRFKDALPPPSWDDVFNATERMIVCPQANIYNYEVNIIIDCLKINIFVPDSEETNIPVLFYIHGGSHQSGHPGMYSQIKLAQRGMIVVNFNYRVGVYGFLCLNNEFAPGNAGVKDQILAMKWVQRNIANFGGDPNRITISASSSGSTCVELQVLSPMSNGLFQAAAPVGGSGIADIVFSREPLSIAEKFAEQFGVITDRNITRLETFYRSLSDDQLSTNAVSSYKEIGFAPCIETHNVPGVEKFLAERPIDILTSGNYEKVPIMSGFTPMEGLFYLSSYDTWMPLMEANFTDFLPESISVDLPEKTVEATENLRNFYFPNGAITYVDYVNFFTDLVFAFPMYAFARLHARHQSAYLYLFSYNGTVNLPGTENLPIWGPGHVTPILYMQDNIQSYVYDNMTEEEFVIQEKLTDLFSSFVINGVPSSDQVGVTWLPVSSNVEYLQMDSEFVLGQFPLRERLEIWDRIYEYNYSDATDSAVTSSLSILVIIVSVCAMIVL